MNNKYYNKYKLLKELPDYPMGWLFSWCGIRRKYLPHKLDDFNEGCVSEYSKDYDSKTTFTKEEVESKKEWFEPIGKSKDWIPEFPSKQKLDEYVYLLPETRLVDSVDFCRAFNDLLEDKKFQNELYEFYKNSYIERYDL